MILYMRRMARKGRKQRRIPGGRNVEIEIKPARQTCLVCIYWIYATNERRTEMGTKAWGSDGGSEGDEIRK